MAVADGLDDLIPLFAVGRIAEGEECLLAGQSIEQGEQVGVRVDFHAVYFLQDVACGHFGAGTVERAFLHDFGDAYAFARICPVVKQAKIGC